MMKRKSILISLFALLSVMRVSAQGVSFHSEDFANAVRYHIGLDESADISPSQLDTITGLDLSGLDLTDIRDVVNLPNVRSLNLEGNKIENVAPLANLDSLRVLNLCHNQLESINELVFSHSPEMTIDVAFNYIQDFSCFITFTSCCFTIEGTSFQSVKNAPYFDVRELHADLIADNVIDVFYRGYTNMPDQPILTIGQAESEALVDGDIHIVTVSEAITETAQVTLTNGQMSEITYVVPPREYQVKDGETVILETGLPNDYILSYVSAKAGTINIENNTIEYQAPETAVPDVVYFSYYEGGTLKGSSRFYINKDNVDVEAITIGKSGKASYCGDKSLDFSFSEEVKAYIATGFDKDEGIIWLTRVKDVPAGVPVLIKGEAEKTYNVPVTDSQNSYYTNMFVGNTSGASIEIYETSADGSKVNYYLKDGTFLSVTGNAKIGKNKCYLQLPATFNASVTGTSQTVTVGSTGKASFAASVDLDFTNVDGLKAFTATGYDKSTKTIWLTRVVKVQQGEGVLLKGDPDNYEIPSVAAQSHYENMFVGNTSGASIEIYETSADGSQTNYYLKGGTFLSVTGNAKIGNNKCYLALPTSMVATGASTRGSEKSYKFEEPEMIKLPISFRSLENDGDGTTGIKVQSSMSHVPSDAYYTLQGQRVVNPGKGLYIKNGKKVIVK